MSTVLSLPSNSSMNLYPENRISHYRVQFPKVLEFKDTDYEVGLAAFTYPRTWFNFSPAENYEITYFLADTEGKISALLPGHYDNVAIVLRELRMTRGVYQSFIDFEYAEVMEKIIFKFDTQLADQILRIKLSPNLARKLGWAHQEVEIAGSGGTIVFSPGVIRIDELDAIYVNCDLARDDHVVGHVMQPLLQTVCVKGSHGDMMTYEPQNISWLPLRKSFYTSTEVMICDGQGRLVPFERGTCIVQVHIRRRSIFT